MSKLDKRTIKLKLPLFILISMLINYHTAVCQQKDWMVRLAKIEVDPAYISKYKTALQEHAAAAIKLEPGVLALYAMYEKEHPNRVMVLEIYANKQAYEAHIKTPHFLKYKTGTLKMVKSLELVDVNPIVFAAKPGNTPPADLSLSYSGFKLF